MRKELLIIFLIFFTTKNIYSQEIGIEQDISARVMAMGEATIGDASDISCLYYNPAGLSRLRGEYIIYTHSEFLFTTYHYIGFGSTNRAGRGIGLSMFIGNISGEDLSGLTILDYRQYAYSLSYSTRIDPQLSIGATIKKFQEPASEYDPEAKQTGYKMDFGLLFQVSDKLRTGMIFNNLYSRIRAATPYTLETKLSLGASYEINETTKVVLDLRDLVNFGNYTKQYIGQGEDAYKSSTSINLGFEKWLDENIALRGGYIYGRDIRKSTAGVGIVLGPWRVDYAYNPKKREDTPLFGFYNQPHKLSVMMKLK